MAKTFTGGFKISATGSLDNSQDLGSSSYVLNYSKSYPISNGTGADMANMLWTDTRTIAPSATDDLDLAGVLLDVFGASILFTKIKGIIISSAAANANLLLVGGNTNGFINWVADKTDIIKVRPGGTFALYAGDSTGYAVTPATGDILTVTNSAGGTSVTYDIVIIGCV